MIFSKEYHLFVIGMLIFQTLGKAPDLTPNQELDTTLLNLQWIVGEESASGTLKWNCVALLTKACVEIPSARELLREQVTLLRGLTKLLWTLSETANGKIAKLLELMRYLTQGTKIERLEVFLEKLVHKLLK